MVSILTHQDTVFCRGHDFATFSLKKIKCRIQNCAPFVAYEFAWRRILNTYTVISPDKQNNDRMVWTAKSLTRSLFVLLTTLKQCIHLKWPLNILTTYLTPVTYIITNKTLLILSIFRKRWSPYFPAKKCTWSDRLRLLLQSFLKLQSFLCNNYNGYSVYLQ